MPEDKTMLTNPIKEALRLGQSVWYDGFVPQAEFARLIREDGVRGATTNPTIFEKAILSGAYDAEIRSLSKSLDAEGIYRSFVVKAVQEVADIFKPVHEETGGLDGYVSLEVSPLLARDTAGTIEEARQLHRLTNRKNVMIKVPATREGLPAIQALIRDGIHVNVTLIFSVERHRQVMEAYLSGLEQRLADGKSVSGIASVASFFVSRVDSAVDKLLEDRIKSSANEPEGARLKSLMGRAAVSNSKAAYREFERIFGGDRFLALQAKGAGKQRPLWASTGTKNPLYSDVLYVETLIGQDTVNTMPPATLDAFRDHGRPAAAQIRQGVSEAEEVLKSLAVLGIDLSAVTRSLEEAGVDLFVQSYKKIIEAIGVKKT